MKREKVSKKKTKRRRSIARQLKKIPTVAQTYDLSPFVDNLFQPIDRFCLKLGVKIGYFRPQTVDFSIYNIDADFTHPETSDQRENFIPVRFPIVLERLLDKDRFDAATLEKMSDFGKLSNARFHYEALQLLDELREAFAPFDQDSDHRFERTYTSEEKERNCRVFFSGVKRALKACNFNELPRNVVDKLLKLHAPGSLPIVASYDDFVEYHFYYRGRIPNPPELKKPHRFGGKSWILKSETLSRVCVLAWRKERRRSKLENFTKILDAATQLADAELDEERQFSLPEPEPTYDTIVVKLFKNVAVENLKMVAPVTNLRLSATDRLKISGPGSASVLSAVAKFVLKRTCLCFFMILFMLVSFAPKFMSGMLNRRSKYLQKYVERLYSKVLASNFAAVNMIVSAAEEQDVKEFVLGYFIALKRDKWSTEAEINDDAEKWIKAQFMLDVDFESRDAISKLLQKKILLQREKRTRKGKTVLNEKGSPVMEYRAVSLDEALRILDKDWDEFFMYNV